MNTAVPQLDDHQRATIRAALTLFRQYGWPDNLERMATDNYRFDLMPDDDVTALRGLFPHVPAAVAADDLATKPYTVLLMLPDYERDDAAEANQWVARFHVSAWSPAEAGSIAQAKAATSGRYGGEEDPDADDFAVVAVFDGHVIDQFIGELADTPEPTTTEASGFIPAADASEGSPAR